jgi:hypothetical protein
MAVPYLRCDKEMKQRSQTVRGWASDNRVSGDLCQRIAAVPGARWLRPAIHCECNEGPLPAHFDPKEWLHTHILTDDRGVPFEVLEGVVESDGDWLVRGSVTGLCPPLSAITCLLIQVSSSS